MIRIGVDFGGTKIEAAALDHTGEVVARVRAPNPGAYDLALDAVADLMEQAEREAGASVDRIGVGAPGSISPATGLMRNANSTWLNGKPFREDLERRLARKVRLTNDANCLAVSEAVDGAGASARVLFAAILGTGCGGGVAIDGRVWDGVNGIAGEWGHTPLPWPSAEEHPGPQCWCGRFGCLEKWVSGTGLEDDYERHTGARLKGSAIVDAADQGESGALAALERHADRLGRALAMVCDILDPDVIVLGGGLSNLKGLPERVRPTLAERAFSDRFVTPIRPALHGDSSGVRGAAWLWPEP